MSFIDVDDEGKEVVEKKQQDGTKGEEEIILTRIKSGYSFKWNKLLFEYEHPYIFHDTKLYLENKVIFDFWENNFNINKIHFSNQNIHYEHEGDCIPFILRFEQISGVVERSGRNDDRNHYFRPTALIQTSLIHDIFARFVDKITTDLKVNYNDVVDNVRFRLNCSQKLPVKRVVYFRNLLACFEKVKKILFRGKNQYHLIPRVLCGEVLLNKK